MSMRRSGKAAGGVKQRRAKPVKAVVKKLKKILGHTAAKKSSKPNLTKKSAARSATKPTAAKLTGRSSARSFSIRRAAQAALRRAQRPKPALPRSPYDVDLDKNSANYQSLTPLTFLERAAKTFPDHIAIVHGAQKFTYAQFYDRARRLASALHKYGLKKNETVALMLANTPPMLDAHYGVAMAGGVLNALNTRLDPSALAFILDHGEAKVLITDREFAAVMKETLALITLPYPINAAPR